jgi:Ca2+-binding EF-hand superfamily protein
VFKPTRQLGKSTSAFAGNRNFESRDSFKEKAQLKVDKNATTEEAEHLKQNATALFRWASGLTIGFISIGVVFFCASKQWTFINSLYFVVVTLTTVGYGDQSAWEDDLDDGVLLFMTFYALIGIMLVGSALGIIAASIVEAQEANKDAVYHQMLEESCGDGTPKAMSARETVRATFRAKFRIRERALAFLKRMFGEYLGPRILKLAPGVLRMVVTIIMGMVLIYFDHKHMEEPTTLTFIQCLYYAVITCTTIGYGDISPMTQWGRALGTAYVMFGVVSVGNVFGEIASAFIEAKQQEALEKILQKKITVEDFAHFDIDGDGRIEKTEFVVRKLMLMGILKQDDVTRVEQEFDVMDTDGSGEITMEDLNDYIRQREANLAERQENQIVVSPKGSVRLGDSPSAVLGTSSPRNLGSPTETSRMNGGRPGNPCLVIDTAL